MTPILNTILLQIQHTADMQNADDTQKFFVVVAVIAVLFAGITAYLISIDRKLKKAESTQN